MMVCDFRFRVYGNVRGEGVKIVEKIKIRRKIDRVF